LKVLRWIQPHPWALEFANVFAELGSGFLENLVELSMAQLNSEVLELVSQSCHSIRVLNLPRFIMTKIGRPGFGWLERFKRLESLELFNIQKHLIDLTETRDETVLPFEFLEHLKFFQFVSTDLSLHQDDIRYVQMLLMALPLAFGSFK
jgi:hypothetical protein